jgi:hypothetical protein
MLKESLVDPPLTACRHQALTTGGNLAIMQIAAERIRPLKG